MKSLYAPLSLLLIFSSIRVNAESTDIESVPQLSALTPQSAVFRENKGQWDQQIKYRMTRFDQHDAHVMFMSDKLVYNITRYKNTGGESDESTETLAWLLNFEGVDPSVEVNAIGENTSRSHYFVGRDEAKHATNVKDYSAIRYKNLYKGIDLHYYLHNLNLKYDFILQPKAEVGNIKLKAEGVESMQVNRKGELEIETAWGTLIEKTPYSYQVIDGQVKEVDVRFSLKDNTTFGFEIYGSYDKTHELVIDPVVLNWSTFARAMQHSYAHNIALDDDGYVYITGKTEDQLYMSPGVFDNTYGNAIDGYVMKFEPDGSNVLYSAYIGGSGAEWGTGIDVGPDGSVFVVGWTASDDLPTSLAGMQRNRSGNGQDGYIMKLAPDGSAITYASYLGGSRNDYVGDGYTGNTGNNRRNYIGTPLKVNDKGEAFITGWTISPDFPTTIGAHPGGFGNYGFVIKMNTTGTGVVYSKLIGNGKPKAIAINSADEVFLAGDTYSTSFPTTPGVISTTVDATNGDIFAMRIAADGQSYIYSTLLQGSQKDIAYAIDINDQNEAFVGGQTRSPDIGTVGSLSAIGGGGSDAIVARISSDGKQLLWASYIGEGQGSNAGNAVMGIDVTSKNEVFMAIQTGGVTGALPKLCSSKGFGGSWDHYIAKVNENGLLEFASYMGGSHADYGSPKIAVKEECGCASEIFISGDSHSPNFPSTPGTFEPNKPNGAYDQPVVYSYKAETDVDFSFTPAQCSQPVNFTTTYNGSCAWKPGNWTPSFFWWDFGDGLTSTAENPVHTYTAGGTYEVKMIAGCPCDTLKKTIVVPGDPNLKADLGPDKKLCGSQAINIPLDVGPKPGMNIEWNTGANTQSINATSAGKYWVKVSDGTCTAIDTITIVQSNLSIQTTNTDAGCDGTLGTATVTANQGEAPFTYQWNDPAQQTTGTASNLIPGTYEVEVTDAIECKKSETVTIVEDPSRVEGAITFQQDAGCASATGMATVTPSGGTTPYSYQWNDPSNQTSRTATNLPAGIYTCFITDVNGCSGQVSVEIKGSGGMATSTTMTLDDGCDRFGGTLGNATATPTGGVGPYTYNWNDAKNQKTQTATGLTIGTYTVTVTDAGGCSATSTVTIPQKIQVSIQVDNEPCTGCSDGQVTGSVSGFGTPPFTYRWDDGNEQTSLTATGLPPGTYVLLVTDSKGCFNSDTVSIGGITSVHEFESENVLKVFPNPSTGRIQLIHPDGISEFKIYDSATKLLLNQQVPFQKNVLLNLDELVAGIYILEYRSKEKIGYSRIVLQQ